PEHLAFPGFQHALEHLTTLAGLRVSHTHARDGAAAFSVKASKSIPDLQRRVGDKPEATPLEVRTQLHHLMNDLQGLAVAVPRYHRSVLVFHLTPPCGKLFEEHIDGLEDIQRLEPGNHDGLVKVARDELVRPTPNHG